MTATTTTRLGLYKTSSDGSDLVNVVTDLLNNWDKLDLAVGARVVTSSTRPSTPFGGQLILESDTSYRSYVNNGTSPASAGWVEIPNGSATYGSQIWASRATDATTLRVANTFGGGNTNPSVLTEHAAAAAISYGARVSGDTFDRIRLRADGRIDIGPGTGARDTSLYRSAAGTLKTDGSLVVNSTLSVSGTSTLTGNVTVSGTTTLTGNVTVSGTISSLTSSDAEDTTSRTTTSTSMVTVAGLTPPTLVVPPSGKVKVTLVTVQRNSTTNNTFSSFRAVGSTSGTVVSESTTGGIVVTGGSNLMGTKVRRITGLVPGETLTVTPYHMVNAASTATFDYRYVLVEALGF